MTVPPTTFDLILQYLRSDAPLERRAALAQSMARYLKTNSEAQPGAAKESDD